MNGVFLTFVPLEEEVNLKVHKTDTYTAWLGIWGDLQKEGAASTETPGDHSRGKPNGTTNDGTNLTITDWDWGTGRSSSFFTYFSFRSSEKNCCWLCECRQKRVPVLTVNKVSYAIRIRSQALTVAQGEPSWYP